MLYEVGGLGQALKVIDTHCYITLFNNGFKASLCEVCVGVCEVCGVCVWCGVGVCGCV